MRIFLLLTFLAAPVGLAAQTAGGDMVLSGSLDRRPRDIFNLDGLRDPFLPVSASVSSVTRPRIYAKSRPHLSSLKLRGMLNSWNGRMAVLYDSGNGGTYFFSGGRLLDLRFKPVAGFSGEASGNTVTIREAGRGVTLRLAVKNKKAVRP